jgi:hypothetical protein
MESPNNKIRKEYGRINKETEEKRRWDSSGTRNWGSLCVQLETWTQHFIRPGRKHGKYFSKGVLLSKARGTNLLTTC